jgi:hypothetical protein
VRAQQFRRGNKVGSTLPEAWLIGHSCQFDWLVISTRRSPLAATYLSQRRAQLGKDRDVLSVYVQLHAVAVEFYFMEPLVADRRTIATDWRRGDDERGATAHTEDVKWRASSCNLAARRSRYLKRGPSHSSTWKSTALEPRGKNDVLISAGERRALRYAVHCHTHTVRTPSIRRARISLAH